MFRHWINDDYVNERAGDVLRGIIDKDYSSDYMLSLNLDLPVRAIRFKPSNWFNNPKMRVFDFDLHLSPVLDVALAQYYGKPNKNSPETAYSFDIKDILVGSGLEFTVFPDFFRSLFLNVSFGFDIFSPKEYPIKDNKRPEIIQRLELFFGTELHY